MWLPRSVRNCFVWWNVQLFQFIIILWIWTVLRKYNNIKFMVIDNVAKTQQYFFSIKHKIHICMPCYLWNDIRRHKYTMYNQLVALGLPGNYLGPTKISRLFRLHLTRFDRSKHANSKENGISGHLEFAQDYRGNLGISQILHRYALTLWIGIKITCAAYRPILICVTFT